MDFGRLTLDFEGRRIQGENPFLLVQDDLAHLENALSEAARRFPEGGAVGFWSYEAARLWEPRAFGAAKAETSNFPLFRLVFFERLVEHPYPPQNIVWRRTPLSLRDVPDLPAVREFYQNGVRTIRDYIAAGDIYQANLTHRFEVKTRFKPSTIYQRLDDILPFGPSPRGALLEWDDFSIVSNSPETFLTLKDGVLESRPIKGTIQRGKTPTEDEALKHQLEISAKDRAENVMIVDLLRNDLGRVCEFGSVQVPQLCAIETFPTLHHLVSTVRGKLRGDCTPLQAFQAGFPCGSITGAPKIRSMQILHELEHCSRGVSMGAIGYFGFDGSMEWNVAIRTATVIDQLASFHVGGGIVADSQPESEYAEMRLKARALWSALTD